MIERHQALSATLAVTASIVLATTGGRAEEGGSGYYVPGGAATIVDLPPTTPGFIFQVLGLHYGGEVSVERTLPIAGRIAAGLEARADVVTLGGLYTFEERILGAFYTIGAYVPSGDVEVTASLDGPLGRFERTDRVSGLGDVTLVPALLAWKTGELQYGVTLPIYAPTGLYDADRLANVGKNYWSVDPTVYVSYSGATTGFNASMFAGITINSENPATDYRSGSLLHVEASVQQLLPVGPGFLGVGLNAFALQQVTPDTGSGAVLGGFEGRSLGIGPTLTYVAPLPTGSLAVEARWLPEIETKNRVSGDYFWLKGAIPF